MISTELFAFIMISIICITAYISAYCQTHKHYKTAKYALWVVILELLIFFICGWSVGIYKLYMLNFH